MFFISKDFRVEGMIFPSALSLIINLSAVNLSCMHSPKSSGYILYD